MAIRIFKIASLLFLSVIAFVELALAKTECDVAAMLIKGSKQVAMAKKEARGFAGGESLSPRAKSAKLRTSNIEAEEELASGFAAGLQEQLSALPRANYSPLETKKERVSFGTKAMFSLRDSEGGAHQIEVTPLHSVSNKIHALVHWRGPDNSTLLSTKLWITNGQNMLLGTEINEEISLVVNVSIGCKL